MGIACRFIYREEEGFGYIQNAFLQLDDPPQSLILSYISAEQTSDHFLSLETIKALSQKATAKGITFEVALNMASLAYTEGKEAEKQYWKEKANIAEKNRSHTAIIIPNILKGICKIREGCFYEK